MESTTGTRVTADSQRARRVLQRTKGKSTGPITRLASPSDIGQLIKPFVFLDYVELSAALSIEGLLHPHSGIATLTALVGGSLHLHDSKGRPRSIMAGGVEWMQAGRGVWHGGSVRSSGAARAYQLWVALPPALELSAPSEMFLRPEEVPSEGPAQVLLGCLNDQESPISVPQPMTYLHVRLSEGENWRYTPPQGHDVLWISLYSGSLDAGEQVSEGEMVIFEKSERSVDFVARENCGFVLGSAAHSPFDLVEGYYSVHTNTAALHRGEQEIARVGAQLCAEGRLTHERAIHVASQMSAVTKSVSVSD
ncbi:pirin family protein [Paraburkholderia sp. SARCC-3016]|jgi:redox-sensitive bicupin YhaK (pirin superfamily)|uniref:pirin family protein n=1 Tax=Paraburkholderia sp. SARCC-3016 TaxID=3058611 RepID=UPI002806DAE0|nr:pirin family protein [Paraburkholderia sp. SARCC-3016]MDQ7981604.1 pirin family protein [Paraburkholderia sp. SARCC-3016]